MKIRIVSVILVFLFSIGVNTSYSVEELPSTNPVSKEITDREKLTSEMKKRIDHLEKLRPKLARQITLTKSLWKEINPADPEVPFRTAYRLVEVQVLTLERLPLICTSERTSKRVLGPFQKCPKGFKKVEK